MPDRRRPPRAGTLRAVRGPVRGAGVAALLLAVAFLLAPAMGTDLAAQVARANFVDRFGATPIDLGWYGGVNQFGYSLFTAGLGAALGVRVVGALAAVGSALALAWLLVRAGARRPVLGALLGAVVLVGNLVSGRITFAVGLLFGLLALCAVAATGTVRSVPGGWVVATGGGRAARVWWLVAAGVLAALATWASPVAGLFVGLTGGALLLANLRLPVRPGPPPRSTRSGSGRARRWRAVRWRTGGHLVGGLVLCLAPAVALAPMALLFGNGGVQPYSFASMRTNVVLALVVLVVVPRRWPAVRVGAGLTVLLLIGAYYLESPIGSNALRLPMLFAVPLVAALADLRWRWLVPLLVAAVWWQNPVMVSDLTRAGSTESRAGFYRPLVTELSRRAPIGRIEVVPLRDHWESAYVAPHVPLARGWERQVDVDRNPLFYADDLTPAEYVAWLRRNAVSYVAFAPDSPPDRYARQEAALVGAGLPELRPVWQDRNWRLYQVTDPSPLVAAPGRLVRSDQHAVTFASDVPGDLLVRVRWSGFLAVTGQPGACLLPSSDGWTVVRVTAPGEHRLGSSLTAPGPRC
ncbi:hypothetical protein BDK92_1635 [Micromonospora pisi]|uniref:4-amino-4-deoxy-L-arabinose transferase-like glycosyltransferase n=1 Tax=Micromonospora pisi TaxID=589240 RepID=A0A495JED4_9ACTN|nr:hypothetical protein [Micromonospora pisi]RKR87360.1 hypothetical protein BDK92_1635 [Micromonospora pisi]